jgi:hypothetical protein
MLFDRPKPTAGCSATGRRIYQLQFSWYSDYTITTTRSRKWIGNKTLKLILHNFVIVAACILISPKFFIHQQMHFY